MNAPPKVILCKREYGWSATFFNVSGMPDDVEMPLTFSSLATLARVCEDMARRFPKVERWYRDTLEHVSRCAW